MRAALSTTCWFVLVMCGLLHTHTCTDRRGRRGERLGEGEGERQISRDRLSDAQHTSRQTDTHTHVPSLPSLSSRVLLWFQGNRPIGGVRVSFGMYSLYSVRADATSSSQEKPVSLCVCVRACACACVFAGVCVCACACVRAGEAGVHTQPPVALCTHALVSAGCRAPHRCAAVAFPRTDRRAHAAGPRATRAPQRSSKKV